MPQIYIIPTPLNESTTQPLWAKEMEGVLLSLSCFVVEDVRTARRALKSMCPAKDISVCEFIEYNGRHHTIEIKDILSAFEGKDIGLMSDAGMPAVADPGADFVLMAHTKGYQVKPLIGPSSIIMALAASGLGGQHFTFHGYLPKEQSSRVAALKAIEVDSKTHQRTHLFIEAPHHNDSIFKDICQHCASQTRVCIATALSFSHETIRTQTVLEWKQSKSPELHKQPTVFIIKA